MKQRTLVRSASLLIIGMGLFFLHAPLPSAPSVRAAGTDYCYTTISTAYSSQCYPPNLRGQCIAQEFYNYWESGGGNTDISVFGYPITGIACEVDLASGNRYYTQWFERRRLEVHPELPADYYISEGLLGVERLKQLSRSSVLGNPIDSHFLSYRNSHGLELDHVGGYSNAESTALFGLTISGAIAETNYGWTGLTQWFQRSRLEWHTEPPFTTPTVLPGLLGNEVNVTNSDIAKDATNRSIRAEGNNPKLDIDSTLNRAAQNHANYLMLNYGELRGGTDPTLETPGKPGFTGRTPVDRARAVGYNEADVNNVTEVVALFGDPQQAVAFWAQQPAARALLQDPRYRLMGYGYGQLTVDPNTGRGVTGVDVVDLGTGATRTALCTTFESLPPGQAYPVGATFTENNIKMTPLNFVWSNGTPTAGGFARVATGGQARGSGQDLELNNINLDFDFGPVARSLTLRFGEYGGNLNIRVNGQFRNFGNFADINQATIGNAAVAVNIYDPRSNNGSGDLGILTLSGAINQFALGGQELWIDDVCAQP